MSFLKAIPFLSLSFSSANAHLPKTHSITKENNCRISSFLQFFFDNPSILGLFMYEILRTGAAY